MADGEIHVEVKETGQDVIHSGMEGGVKVRGSGREIGHRSGPGRPVEFLNRASGIHTEPSAPPQCSLNRRSNRPFPGE